MSEIDRAPDSQNPIDQKPEGISDDEYKDLIAAVDEAKGSPAPEAEAKPAPKAEDKPADEPAKESDLPPLTAAIRQRVQEHTQKQVTEAQTQAERIKAEAVEQAKSEAARILKEAQEQARAEQEAWRNQWRSSPLDALKKQGIDPDTLVNEVVKEGSPEWKLLKQQEQAVAELRQQQAETKRWRDEQAAREKQFEEMQAQQRRNATVQEFISLANPEKAPHLRQVAEEAHRILSPFIPSMRNPDDWVVLLGDHAHAQAVQSNGGVASLADLVQHLDYVAREQSAAKGQAQDPSAAPTTRDQGVAKSAQNQRAPGPRTLSASTAGERRSSPQKPSRLDEEDLLAAMEAGFLEASRQPNGAAKPRR